MDTTEPDLSVQYALTILRRRAPWIVLCFVVVTAAAFGLSRLQTKQYTAVTSLLFTNSPLAQEVAGLSTTSPSSTEQSVQDTNVELAKIGDMAGKTAHILGRGLTAQRVRAAISVAPLSDTSVVSVSATSTSPVLAAEIANTYSTVFVTEQESSNRQYYVSALATVNQQLAKLSLAQRSSAQGLALQDRAQSLATLAELPSGTVEVAATARVPTTPSSPKTIRNTVLGALLGLVFGLGMALFLERLDQRMREPEDLEHIYRVPLLGVVPTSSALARAASRNGSQPAILPPRELEVFQLIRAHLGYLAVDRTLHTLLIASAHSADGKTTVATNLGFAAAQTGTSVLLVEADLRRPCLAKRLNVDPTYGLADVLVGKVSLDRAVQRVDLTSSTSTVVGNGLLAVLSAGATTPPNPHELLDSHAMESLLGQFARRYDLVLLDSAPLAAVSDTFPLLKKVDGVILVGRIGQDRRDVARRLRHTLDSGGGPLLGVIANGVNIRHATAYSYGANYV